MTPAQLDLLAGVHRDVHSGKGRRGGRDRGRDSSTPTPGTAGDLLAFANMPVV